MRIVKRAAVVMMSGLLMGAGSVSTWAAIPAGNIPAPSNPEVVASANASGSATARMVEPSLALQASHHVHSNCEASHMYGADNVVGDASACIRGGYAIPGGLGVGAVGVY